MIDFWGGGLLHIIVERSLIKARQEECNGARQTSSGVMEPHAVPRCCATSVAASWGQGPPVSSPDLHLGIYPDFNTVKGILKMS